MRRMPRCSIPSAVLVAAVASGSSLALAQESPGFDLQPFHPAVSQQGGFFTVPGGAVLSPRQWEATLLYNHADDPLVILDEDGEEVAEIVGAQNTFDLLGGIGLGNGFELGVDLPLHLLQGGERAEVVDVSESGERGFGIGDIRLAPRWSALANEVGAMEIALSFALEAWLPTGDDGAWQGEPFRIRPSATGEITLLSGLRVAANLGWLARAETTVDNLGVNDTLGWALAGAFPASGDIDVLGELSGQASLLADEIGSEELPMELLVGARWTDGPLAVQGGIGGGLVRGFGSPNYRLLLGAGWSPAPAPAGVRDTDGDGLADRDDACPRSAEDPDAWEDADGCPDPDNDADGIADVDDDCRMEPEDPDGLADGDGCPEQDIDNDRVSDEADGCDSDPEDLDGFEDEDGCPDENNDGDALFDYEDHCPNEMEDPDGFEDEDGCPDPDNDSDGIRDPNDACPDQAEVINGNLDEDGCPDEGESLVQLGDSQIVILERVNFDSGSDRIRPDSFALLDQVASVILAHRELTQVRIEGHTDSRGDEGDNLALSQARAEAVRTYLIGKGVEPSRLTAEGFGETRPVADNSSNDGRQQNRRVEFHIVSR